MKLTQFTIFIILLIVLIISVYFSKYLSYLSIEPFISYNYKANVDLDTAQVIVPPYSTSRSIYKVYDSIYYDPQNGNVLELFGTPYTNTVDTTGTSLTNMILMPRVGSLVVEYDASQTNGFTNVAESNYLNAAMTSTYTSWYYPNSSNISAKLASSIEYQVFCFPWKMDSVIFVNDIMKKMTVGLYGYMGSNLPDGLVKSINYNMTYQSSSNSDYNQYTNSSIDGYNVTGSKIYNIFYNTWFDTTNGVIIYKDTTRNVTNTDSSLQFSNTKRTYSMSYTGSNGGNIILGIPFSSNRSMVVVLGADQTNSNYMNILNVVRFDPSMPNGIDNSMQDGGCKANVTTNAPAPIIPATAAPVAPVATAAPAVNMNDYISKTQIVPPVCPACPVAPACPSQPSTADTLVDTITKLKALGINLGGSAAPSTPSPDQVNGWKLANNMVNAPGNIISSTEGSAVNLGQGAYNLVGGVSSDVTGLAKEVVSGATQLGLGAENVVGNVSGNLIGAVSNLGTGAENVAGSAISNVSNVAGGAITGAENVIGSSVIGAENVAGSTVTGAENIIGSTATGAENIIGNTSNKIITGASNVATGGEEMVSNVVESIGNTNPVVIQEPYNTSMPPRRMRRPPRRTSPPEQTGPTAPVDQSYTMTTMPSSSTEGDGEGDMISNLNAESGNTIGPKPSSYVPTQMLALMTSMPPTPESVFIGEVVDNQNVINMQNIPTIGMTYMPEQITMAPTMAPIMAPTMAPTTAPTEEIYECEDEDTTGPAPPTVFTPTMVPQFTTPPNIERDLFKYFYNVPPGPGINDYFGAIPNRATNEFAPMSSDLSRFGR